MALLLLLNCTLLIETINNFESKRRSISNRIEDFPLLAIIAYDVFIIVITLERILKKLAFLGIAKKKKKSEIITVFSLIARNS